jgi:DNA-binding winged helix-turn-helix (wHTH) protein
MKAHYDARMTKVTIFENDAFVRQAIATTLSENGLASDCAVLAPQESAMSNTAIIWIDSESDSATSKNDQFAKPLRMGALLDRVRWHLLKADQNHSAKKISIGPYMMDCLHNVIFDTRTGHEIRLTEKERHILEVLEAASGRKMDRRALLEKVWGYADNIETHTLETHIYRLRQKIEADPAVPTILLTDGQGYKLDFA